MKHIIIWLSICLLFFSCNETHKEKVVVSHASDSLNLIRYAENIQIYDYNAGYKVCIKTNAKDECEEFYLFADSLQVPQELDNEKIIRTPIKSAVTFSSTQWSVFQMIGDIERVKGILEGNYTKNEEIVTLLKEKKIEDVGYENNINIEKLIELQADVIFYTPYPTSDYDNLRKLSGSVMIPFPDYLESHPLGRAEWMKLIAYLCGKEKETEDYFDSVVSRYESLKSICADIEDKPTVFSDLPFENQWYVPGGNSYIARFFADAGADYIWKDDESQGSLHIDAESVIAKAKDADFWRVMNSYDDKFTYEKLADENELYTLFKAFKERNIIVCDVKESAYFEKSQYEPDVILADFIYHFHPYLLEKEWKGHQPRYFKKLIK